MVAIQALLIWGHWRGIGHSIKRCTIPDCVLILIAGKLKRFCRLTLDLPFDKTAYWHSIAARFGNRAIADLLERICMDGWSKMPIFIRPTLAACLAQGIVPRYGFDCIASWYIYARRAAQAKSMCRITSHIKRS